MRVKGVRRGSIFNPLFTFPISSTRMTRLTRCSRTNSDLPHNCGSDLPDQSKKLIRLNRRIIASAGIELMRVPLLEAGPPLSLIGFQNLKKETVRQVLNRHRPIVVISRLL